MASVVSNQVVNDCISKDQLRAMVGESFSEERWESIAQGRDTILKCELMDAVTKLRQPPVQTPPPQLQTQVQTHALTVSGGESNGRSTEGAKALMQ